ncbi:MAG: NAD-dependent epimerase/dehydratase family protein [Candidatus Cloacimonetes bacterium]|nr:NAD-dependent epimerase/dehydratase family protein [Candidatus Cloacimonadota bacterium]
MFKKKRKVLLTGLTGFIGKHTARKIYQKFDITAIVRPGTPKSAYSEFEADVKIVKLNLSDRERLKVFLDTQTFDFILHIGALRGGRQFDSTEFMRANVIATEILIANAIKNNSKFIFCSSVGVYGTIPLELPANLYTPYQDDNLYHKTKIQCEQIIKKAIYEKKLIACIVRPSITYGTDDIGFPYTLTKLVDKKRLYLPKKPIFIHLLNVDTLSEVFKKLLDRGFTSGKIWNVADKKEVCLQQLADFIHNRLHEIRALKAKENMPVPEDLNTTPEPIETKAAFRPYPTKKLIDKSFFDFSVKMAKLFKDELWTSRLELISKSWYYDVNSIYEELNIETYNTIPDFGNVVDWYFDQEEAQ